MSETRVVARHHASGAPGSGAAPLTGHGPPCTRLPAAVVASILATACAGATIGSGVGDTSLRQPPYAAGGGTIPAGACVGHLPVAYQRGASQAEIFDPEAGAGTPIAALLAEMSRALDALGASVPLAPRGAPPGSPPDVRFGCEPDASGDCLRTDSHDVRRPELHISVGRPSRAWTSWLAAALDDVGATMALAVTLEVGQYWTRQKNFRGDKEVVLGTDHAVGIPWLTSLETPVSVLQLTGAAIDRDGKALRIGAEGLLARRTNLLLSSERAQALITDEDVERLRTARRDDLPGRPLVWEEGLRNLVAQLAGGPAPSAAACPGG